MKDIHLDVSGRGKLTSDDIEVLYNALQQGLLTDGSSLVGQCTAEACYEDAVSALHERFPQFSVEAMKWFARFKDPEVLRVLLEHAQHASPDGFTKQELLNITDIGTWFQGNTEIERIDELNEAGITTLKGNAFNGCSSLKRIELDKVTFINGQNSLKGCYELEYICFPNIVNLIYDNTAFSYCGKAGGVIYMPKLIDYSFQTGLCGGSKMTTFLFPSYTHLRSSVFGGIFSSTNLDEDTPIIDIGNKIINLWPNFGGGPDNNKYKRNIVIRAITPPTIQGKPWYGWYGRNTLFVPQNSLSAYQDLNFKDGDNRSYVFANIYAIGGTEWQNAMRIYANKYAKEKAGWTPEQIATADYSDPYIDYRIFGIEPPTE